MAKIRQTSGPGEQSAQTRARTSQPTGDQAGQAIVLVALALVALIAITGLAIDGGRLYQARRQSQNGADAAALAGARVLSSGRCNPSNALDATVRAEVLDYAEKNSIVHDQTTGRVWAWYVDKDSSQLLPVGTGSVPNGTTGVEVRTMITESTSFMRITGQNHMAAAGSAIAMFGPLTSGGGFLPIGVPVDRIDHEGMGPGVGFEIFDGSGAICRKDDADCPSDPPANSQRGWLNFNYTYNEAIHTGAPGPDRVISTSASNAELKEWAENGSPHPLFRGTRKTVKDTDDEGNPIYNYYTDGDLIAGDPGARESSRSIVCDTHMGKTVYIPVFDYIYERAQMREAFPDTEPGNPLQFPNKHFYHIVGFVAAELTSCSNGQKTIEGTFLQKDLGSGTIDPGAGIQIGGGDCSAAVYAVVLWK